MHSITIQVASETERRLKEKAEASGQSVEALLGRIAEEAARGVNGISAPSPETDEEGPNERPWRGIFAPARQRDILFSKELAVPLHELPRRLPLANMNWHRAVVDDE